MALFAEPRFAAGLQPGGATTQRDRQSARLSARLTVWLTVLLKTRFRAQRALWQHWAAVRRQRRALRRMEAHRLDDIGVTRAQALAESGRPFWDAPAHWVDNTPN